MTGIRPAFAADLAELIALDSVAHRSQERRQEIADWIAAGACHVALRAGRIVGYVALTHEFFHQPFIAMLMVGEADRRGGVGLALVRHCIDLVPEGEKLFTSTNQSNGPMRALLAAAGFVPSGIVENLDEGDPELIFFRRLR